MLAIFSLLIASVSADWTLRIEAEDSDVSGNAGTNDPLQITTSSGESGTMTIAVGESETITFTKAAYSVTIASSGDDGLAVKKISVDGTTLGESFWLDTPCQNNYPTYGTCETSVTYDLITDRTSDYSCEPRACVKDHNMPTLDGLSREQCAQECDETAECKAFEYGVLYKGEGQGLDAGQCRMQNGDEPTDIEGCNGYHYNLDLCLPDSIVQDYGYEYVGRGYCRNSENSGQGQDNKVNSFLKDDVTLDVCRSLCDDSDDCVGFGHNTVTSGRCIVYMNRDGTSPGQSWTHVAKSAYFIDSSSNQDLHVSCYINAAANEAAKTTAQPTPEPTVATTTEPSSSPSVSTTTTAEPSSSPTVGTTCDLVANINSNYTALFEEVTCLCEEYHNVGNHVGKGWLQGFQRGLTSTLANHVSILASAEASGKFMQKWKKRFEFAESLSEEDGDDEYYIKRVWRKTCRALMVIDMEDDMKRFAHRIDANSV